MKDRSTEELMKIIGAGRTDCPKDEIREAELEIKRRTSNEIEESKN